MGWDFYSNPRYNKARIVADKIAGEDMVWDGERAKILAHSLRGQHLWRVVEKPDGERFIALDLLRSGGRGEGWGSKGICESMGPNEKDCPLSMLDMVPNPAGVYGSQWREEVRAYHAAKNARTRSAKAIAPGQKVTIHGLPYTIIRKREKRGWIVECPNGNRYRAIAGIVPASA